MGDNEWLYLSIGFAVILIVFGASLYFRTNLF